MRPAILFVVLVRDEQTGRRKNCRDNGEPRSELGVLQRREGEGGFDKVFKPCRDAAGELDAKEVAGEVREAQKHCTARKDDERNGDDLWRFVRVSVTAVLAPERHPVGAAHVRSGKERRDQTEDQHDRVGIFLTAC
ncbi:unannotated protein [freshwater metagenome]|uniref:Unannotated protein n=1 Tax=freshwater metagenome TaxID=449393 RepID=A0A6J6IG40_9ZZZZ